MSDPCGCGMPPRVRSFRTLLLGLTLAAVASFTASSAFAGSVLLSAGAQGNVSNLASASSGPLCGSNGPCCGGGPGCCGLCPSLGAAQR